MVSKQDAPKSLFETKDLELEPESPFLDEAAFDLSTRQEASDSYEAEPEPQLETPFVSPAEQEISGLADEGIEGEIEQQALEAPGREPEEETEEEEGEFEEEIQPTRTGESLEAAGEASPQSQVDPAQVTLRVAELIELWEIATTLNERIRRMVAQILDQQTRTPVAASPPVISLVRPLGEGELEGQDPQQVINGLIGKGLPRTRRSSANWTKKHSMRNFKQERRSNLCRAALRR